MKLESHSPTGPIETRWERHKFAMQVVNPANKRKFKIIMVGTGLAGGAGAASLADLGYDVEAFCYQDSPRRAHSIAAQGGINAAKNYQGDGDSIYRLFYDTVKGGDFRARESNVYRLAQVSVDIIDQCAALGVPFAREYGGLLANRSFGGAQVSRTFYARGQTGQQLLLGAYSHLARTIASGKVKMHERCEMVDLIVVDGRARGIVTRDLVTGKVEAHLADAVILATGGYGNVFYLSTNAKGCNTSAIWRAHRRGAGFANPCFTQIHPTCIPQGGDYQSKLTLMSESLRNDGRIWVPRKKEDCTKDPSTIAEKDRYYYLEEKYPKFGNLMPRDVASRQAKFVCDDGLGVGPEIAGVRRGVYLDFADAIKRDSEAVVREKYGNLFDMYERITGENPYKVPMRIYPATHYTMGGLWVDYNLQSTIPGLLVAGEANFSEHGANRLGASALMQGLADGFFILPYVVGHYLADAGKSKDVDASHPEVKAAIKSVEERVQTFIDVGQKGKRTVDDFHRELGAIIWNHCGMARTEKGLKEAIAKIPTLHEEFRKDVKILGGGEELNRELEKAMRVDDFFELGALMCRDALERDESAGCHFREEHQTVADPKVPGSYGGECVRNDDKFAHAAVWEWNGHGKAETRHTEPLTYEFVKLAARKY